MTVFDDVQVQQGHAFTELL